MNPAEEALSRLRAGNARFVERIRSATPTAQQAEAITLPREQKPMAIVLGCADARVPAELVFDQGLGDLFVIRVAGNIVAPSGIGSMEFAASRFGTRLVVVLGHTECGAVTATVEELLRPAGEQSPNLSAIVERVRPAVAPVVSGCGHSHTDAIVPDAVRANIRHSVAQIHNGSEILRQLIRDDGLKIVGAEYDLASGQVHFLDDD
ncbi:carbonic anhydrase [Algiphilus sp.]|uniref:carbonic anhydrase n=2 Tax=Algiphilus sp. TaxID=1872431 RepID=UPI003C609322